MSFACIYVPNFLLQALLYVESTLRDHSLAILDGHLSLPRIIALEEKARRAGVTLGMPQDHAMLLGVTLRKRSFNAENISDELFFSKIIGPYVQLKTFFLSPGIFLRIFDLVF